MSVKLVEMVRRRKTPGLNSYLDFILTLYSSQSGTEKTSDLHTRESLVNGGEKETNTQF